MRPGAQGTPFIVRRRWTRLLTIGLILVLSATVGAAPTVTLDSADIRVDEGQPFSFVSTVSNAGQNTWPEVTVTLNVVRAGDGVSEDPEDWDPSWSHRFVVVEAGGDLPVQWDIRTIKGGDFLFFVTVLVHGDDASGPWADAVVSSEVLHVHVEPRPAIPTNKLMPVAIGVPLVFGAIFAIRVRSR